MEHSGISTDILLFSELGLSLTQHYRVYRGGLPHAAFRKDYIERLRSLLQSSGQPEARESSSFQPSEETGKSIMHMDTNEITINRVVGFRWDDPGTDLEDEMPTPVLLPVRPCDSCSGDSRSVRPGRRFST